MNRLYFQKATNKDDAKKIASLAREIWMEHYPQIIGKQQVEYMLSKFQSEQAILKDIESSLMFYLIQAEEENIGYIAFSENANELYLSKFYIKSKARSKGYGKQCFEFIKQFAKNKQLPKISLNVNKNNINSIKIYEKLGFNIIKPLVKDIGNGYLMDDYLMQNRISS